MKRHFNLLASVLLVIAMVFAFASCDVISQYIPGINQPEPEHQHDFVDGSCECGEADPNYVAPHEHNFVEGKCECGEADPNYVAPHEHNFVEGKCECGETDPNYVPPHEHSYEAAVTAPTCTDAGYTTYTCACGDSYNADEVAALGHKHETTVVAPTCTDAGYTTYTCACGDSYNADEVKALGHTFVDSKCTKCDAEYVAPAAGDWTLVTELKAGDHVLIGNAKYGKLLSSTKTGYYNVGVNYSADDFANVTDAEIWVVTKNDDGTYSFTSLTGEKLGLADSFTSLNSAGPNFNWTLVAQDETTFTVKNEVRNLYIEWYDSYSNWSTYSNASSDLFYLSFYAKGEAEGEHVHNHISDAHENTCTEDGYTSYTCKCGDTYSVAGEAATGHKHETTVVAPTCTEAGYTKHLCACGDSYNTDETAALGHSFVEGKCTVCGAEDPDYHVHNYVDVITTPATCTATGVMTPTCSCGDTKEPVELEMIPHVDENLDITCDYEGCSKRILPAADSKISLFTANHMVIISLTNNYYVEGTVTSVEDARNGKFVITDDAGDTILIYLPVDADGVTHANWESKVVVGDVVSVYGKPVNPTGLNTTQKAAVKSGVLTFITKHPHDFTFSAADCTEPARCACGQSYGDPRGCVDTDGDSLCDDCGKNANYIYEYVEIRTDNNSGVIDTAAGTYTWGNDNFDVQVVKGSSSQLYSTAKDHMRVYKGNKFAIVSKNGLVVKTIIVHLTNATQVGYFEKFLTGYTYTKDAEKFTVTIEVDFAESIIFDNTGSTTQIKGVEFGYEKPVAKAEPVTVVMANTITDTQTSYMTGGNDAELVGLDPSIFTVTSGKGSYGNHTTLYYKSSLAVPNQIRLFNHSSGNGNSITVSVAEGYKIVSVKVEFTVAGRANGYVVTGADGTELYSVSADATFSDLEEAVATFDVNGSSFTLANVHTASSKQIWIGSIEITYEEV